MANETKLKDSSVLKLILTMSLPMILVMLVNVLYNMADVFFMGRTGDTMAVAGVSLASPVFSAISAFNTLIGFGGCTAVSIALGRSEHKLVKKYTAFVLYFALFLGLLLIPLILVFLNGLLKLLGTDQETLPHAKAYLGILAFGTPFMLTAGALGNTLRADGDSKNPVIIALISNVVNIVLDALLILVFHLGAAGAAAATVASNILCCILTLIAAVKKELFSLSIRDFSLKPEISLHILGLGLPMAAGTLLMSIAHVFSNRLMVGYGNLAVAARSAAGKISMLIPMIIMGVCMGIQPAMSYAYGRNDKKRLGEITLKTGLFALVLGCLMAAAALIFRGALVTAFLPDPKVLELGKLMMIGSVATVPVYAVYQLCSSYLQAVGKVSHATFTSLLRQGIVYIPVLYAMNALFQLNGMIFSTMVSDIISTAIAVVLSLKFHRNFKP